MKDKILEAVQISKTYGEGESAVHALRNSDLTLENGTFASIIVPAAAENPRSWKNSGRASAAHYRQGAAGRSGHLCDECGAAGTGAAAKDRLYFFRISACSRSTRCGIIF